MANAPQNSVPELSNSLVAESLEPHKPLHYSGGYSYSKRRTKSG